MITQKYRPSVVTVLVIVNLVILLLPLASLIFFRIYESQLVREAEAELIAQAAVLGATYKQAVSAILEDGEKFGRETLSNDEITGNGSPKAVLPQIHLTANAAAPPRPPAREPNKAASRQLLELGARFTDMFRDAQRATRTRMRLLNPEGVVIAGDNEVGRSLAHVDEVAAALAGRHKSMLRLRNDGRRSSPIAAISLGTGVRLFVAYPVIERGRLWGVVYMWRTPNNIFYHMYSSRYRLLAISALVVALAILIAWITSRTLLLPIRALSRQADDLARGRRRTIGPLERYGTRELAGLGQSFLEMSSTLDRRSQYVRDFATHVSHEFKTPLTSIRGAAELLREHGETMGDADRDRFLANIQSDTARLKVLVDRLMELARADNIRPEDATIDIVQAVEDQATASPIVEATVHVKSPHLVPLSGESFAIIASNLINNSEQAGATRIEIHVRQSDQGTEIEFHDNGHGVSPGNQERIYDPFFTTRRESGGTGLGLGIVRSLVEAHGGTVTLRTGDDGTTFVLSFPNGR